jgi:hypothetical protein
MSIIVKNASDSTKTWAGMSIPSEHEYTLQNSEIESWRQSDDVIQSIVDGSLLIGNGSEFFSSAHGMAHFFQLDNSPKDADGSSIVRTKTTRSGWHYEPRSIDFMTSKAGSLYNRRHAGNTIDDSPDYGDCTVKFFDANGLELTLGQGESEAGYQARLDSYCVRTQADWQATYDMEIIGATVSVLNPPTGSERAYAWVIVAPDIPAEYGGSVPFMAGGWNLRFFTLDQTTFLDGRGVKAFPYDPVYNSNKIRVVVKHGAGAKIELQFVAEHFRA